MDIQRHCHSLTFARLTGYTTRMRLLICNKFLAYFSFVAKITARVAAAAAAVPVQVNAIVLPHSQRGQMAVSQASRWAHVLINTVRTPASHAQRRSLTVSLHHSLSFMSNLSIITATLRSVVRIQHPPTSRRMKRDTPITNINCCRL